MELYVHLNLCNEGLRPLRSIVDEHKQSAKSQFIAMCWAVSGECSSGPFIMELSSSPSTDPSLLSVQCSGKAVNPDVEAALADGCYRFAALEKLSVLNNRLG